VVMNECKSQDTVRFYLKKNEVAMPEENTGNGIYRCWRWTL